MRVDAFIRAVKCNLQVAFFPEHHQRVVFELRKTHAALNNGRLSAGMLG